MRRTVLLTILLTCLLASPAVAHEANSGDTSHGDNIIEYYDGTKYDGAIDSARKAIHKMYVANGNRGLRFREVATKEQATLIIQDVPALWVGNPAACMETLIYNPGYDYINIVPSCEDGRSVYIRYIKFKHEFGHMALFAAHTDCSMWSKTIMMHVICFSDRYLIDHYGSHDKATYRNIWVEGGGP